MGAENLSQENEDVQDIPKVYDVYDCPNCDLMFPSLADVERHVKIEHEKLTENIVRCSECKKVLPNDQEAIKHHMINEHIKQKQKTVVIDGTPKNEQLLAINAQRAELGLRPMEPHQKYVSNYNLSERKR